MLFYRLVSTSAYSDMCGTPLPAFSRGLTILALMSPFPCLSPPLMLLDNFGGSPLAGCWMLSVLRATKHKRLCEVLTPLRHPPVVDFLMSGQVLCADNQTHFQPLLRLVPSTCADLVAFIIQYTNPREIFSSNHILIPQIPQASF